MTKEVFTVTPDQTTSECMQLMTAKRVRHLPVLDQGKVIGMVSIGDIVKETIHDEESTIHSLEAYIEGRDYGH
jgi:CBS domain-containing protein